MANASASALSIAIIVFTATIQFAATLEWKPKQLYTFLLDGRNVAGSPDLKNQFTGVDISGILFVHAYDSSNLLMKFTNMTYVKLDGEFPGSWWKDKSSSENKTRNIPMSSGLINVQLGNDEIRKMIVPSNMTYWEKNFAKSVIQQLVSSAHLGVDSEKKHSENKISHHSETGSTNMYSSFTVMEDSVKGRCEVLYDIVKLPEPMVGSRKTFSDMRQRALCGDSDVYAITRTTNFSNCEIMSETHHGSLWYEVSNRHHDFFKRASLNRLVTCGDSNGFIVLESVTTSSITVNIQMLNDSSAVVNSRFNIYLKEMESEKQASFSDNVPQSTTRIKSFLYSGPERKKDIFPDCDRGRPSAGSNFKDDLNRSNNEGNADNAQSIRSNSNKSSSHENKREKRSRNSKYAKKNSGNKDRFHGSEYTRSYKEPFHYPPDYPLDPLALSLEEGNERNCLLADFKDAIENIGNDLVNENVFVPSTHDGIKVNDADSENRMEFLDRNNTMEKVLFVVEMCQSLSFKELLQASNSKIHKLSDQNRLLPSAITRNVLRDVIGMCGTKPALAIIRHWLENQLLEDEETIVIFTLIPSRILSRDSETVNYYFELVKYLSSERANKNVMNAAVIGFSNFIRISCVNKKYRRNFNSLSEEDCEAHDADIYVKWMSDKLRSNDSNVRRMFGLAIGNTGSRSALKILTSMMKDDKLSVYQRSRAIISTKYQALYYPKETANVLFDIYNNYSSPVPIRLSALSVLVFARPSLPMWQRIAISTWYEPNNAITSLIQSTITSLSESTNDCVGLYKEMIKMASSVRYLMKPQKKRGNRNSVYNILQSSFDRDCNSSLFKHSSWSASANLFDTYYRHSAQDGLFSSNYEVEGSMSNHDNLLTMFKSFSDARKNTTRFRPPMANFKRTTEYIHNALHFARRKPSQFEGDFRLKLNNLVESLWLLDEKAISYFPKWRETVKEKVMTKGITHGFQKIFMDSLVLSVSTELGLPVQLKIHLPWMFHSKVNLKVTENKSVNTSLSFRQSSGMYGEFGFFTPWDSTSYTTGIHGMSLRQIPDVKFNIQIDRDYSKFTVKTETIDENRVLFYHFKYPFTSQRNLSSVQWIKRNTRVKRIQSGKLHKENISSVPQIQGFQIFEGNRMTVMQLLQEMNPWSNAISSYFNRRSFIAMFTSKIDPITITFSMKNAKKSAGELIINGQKVRNKIQNPDQFENSDSVDKTVVVEDEEEEEEEEESEERGLFRRIKDWIWGNSSEKLQTTHSDQSNTTETVYDNTHKTTYPDVTENSTEAYLSNVPKLLFAGVNNIEEENQNEVIYLDETYKNNDDFNVRTMRPFLNTTNRNRKMFLLSQVLKGITDGHAVAFELNTTVHSSKSDESFVAFGTFGATGMNSLQRLAAFAMNGDSTLWAGLTQSIEIRSASSLSREIAVGDEALASSNMNIVYGINNSKSYVLLKALIMENSSNLDVKECLLPRSLFVPKCHKLLAEKTFLTNMKFSVIPVDEPEPIDFETQDDELIPVTGFSQMYQQWIPQDINPMGKVAISLLNEFSWKNSHSCKITNNETTTFDGVTYYYNLTNCWHVAAKDVSGRSRVVILTRAVRNTTFMDLEVNLDNYRVVRFSKQGIYVNERPIEVSPGTVAKIKDKASATLMSIEQMIDYTFHVVLPVHGFRIIYSNTSSVIYADSALQERLAGICGDFNFEVFGEFTDPKGSLVHTAKEFSSSYSLNEYCA